MTGHEILTIALMLVCLGGGVVLGWLLHKDAMLAEALRETIDEN